MPSLPNDDPTSTHGDNPWISPPPSEIENRKSKIENNTGLPLFSTWPRLYALVLALFALSVLLLYSLTRAYS